MIITNCLAEKAERELYLMKR